MSVMAAMTAVGGVLAIAEKIYAKVRPVVESLAHGIDPDPEKVRELELIVAENTIAIADEKTEWDKGVPDLSP